MFNDLDLYNQNKKKKIVKSINRAIDENNFIFGNNVKKLEKKLSQFTKSKYVITVGSGTDALLISLLSLNLKEDDEVILPSFSWLSGSILGSLPQNEPTWPPKAIPSSYIR